MYTTNRQPLDNIYQEVISTLHIETMTVDDLLKGLFEDFLNVFDPEGTASGVVEFIQRVNHGHWVVIKRTAHHFDQVLILDNDRTWVEKGTEVVQKLTQIL